MPGKQISIELNFLKGVRKIYRIKPIKYYIDFRMEKGKLRIAKFRSDEGILQPKLAQEMIKKNLIYISKDKETSLLQHDLVSFFRQLGAKVYLLDLCRYCAIEGYITGTTNRFLLYHGEKVCSICAKKEIEKEMRFRNIAFSDKILDILKRVRDVDKVLKMFDPAYDVIKDSKLTLIDRMPADSKSVSVPLCDVSMPKHLRSYLLHIGIKELMPVQMLAIEAGLLEQRNLLVSSATASGKTLVAEMAAEISLKNKKKVIYLSPLVALTNQKYEDFKRKWGKTHSISIRVGMSRIKSKEDLIIIDTDLRADIIIGTYEGIDYILRSGTPLGDVGCVVIDEIHMLSDADRGYRLSGLIMRLKTFYPEAQFIGLSATIGNSIELAEKLGMTPVVYDKRPIPLERHIIFKDEGKKKEVIKRIVVKEWQNVSKFGFHGQTMIFTNSRLKCSQFSNYLNSKGIKAAGYHSGLSYSERKKIENSYWKQKIHCVVTTAALSAGVDFPSSVVILESVAMGAKPISVGEFHQMLGRAGRPGYHEYGKVYLLIDPLRKICNEPEDKLAFSLLTGTIENVDVELTDEQELEELLACHSTGYQNISDFNKNALWPLPMEKSKILEQHGFLKGNFVSTFGKATARSFLSIKEAIQIRQSLKKDPLQTAVRLLPFDNVYLSSAFQSMLDTNSLRLFSGEVLEKIENADAIAKLPLSARDIALKIFMDFFVCECDNPFCEHPPQKISCMLLDLRISGFSPKQITAYFGKEYSLLLYGGDVFSYLDQVVHKLEAIERIAIAFNKPEVAKKAEEYIRRIEG